MTNELLEHWLKDAIEKYPAIGPNFLEGALAHRSGYIEGCKATHDKMYRIIYEAYCSGIKFCNGEENYDWETFKKHFNL